jgi:hypothetical protein
LWIACGSILSKVARGGFSSFHYRAVPDLSTEQRLLQSGVSGEFHKFTGPSGTSLSLIYYH